MENLSYLIIKLSRHLKNQLDKELKHYNITASQFSVLNTIANKNSSITSAEISNKLSSDRPTISGIVNRLDRKCMIEKLNNPKDKRSSLIKLTEEGMELIDNLRALADGLDNNIFNELNDKEKQNLKEYLLRLTQKVEGL